MNALEIVGEVAGIMLQLIGVIALLLAGYVFVEGALKQTPVVGWLMSAAALGIVAWPLVAVFARAFDPQKEVVPSTFLSVGTWLWLGCMGMTLLFGLIGLAMSFKRLWPSAVGVVLGALLVAAGYASMWYAVGDAS